MHSLPLQPTRGSVEREHEAADTPMQRVNYNAIAPLYDEPLRDHAVDPHLLAFFDSHPELAPSEARILDIGCGASCVAEVGSTALMVPARGPHNPPQPISSN